MIPISRDHRIKKEFYGVTYSFLPPVGDTELFLMESIQENYTVEQLREAYALANSDIKKEYNGMKLPNKKKIEEMVTDRMKMYLPKNNNDLRVILKTIDKILVGWDLKGTPFPDDCRPSKDMKFELMTEIYTWYWEQYNLTEDEVKNS